MSESSAKGAAWGLFWALQFVWFVCFGLSFNWPAGPIEKQAPYLAISLTVVEIVIAALAIFLAFAAIFSYTAFKKEVQLSARETAIEEAGKSVGEHLSVNGAALIKECLSDAQVVAQLQLEFKKLGIEDSDDAGLVDDDSKWRPNDD